MLTFILLIIVGSILAYISKFNNMPVSVNFGMYVLTEIPLFYVIIGSVLFGLVLSYLFYQVHAISTLFTLRSKDQEIKKNQDEVLQLTKRVHQLELEMPRPKDENAL